MSVMKKRPQPRWTLAHWPGSLPVPAYVVPANTKSEARAKLKSLLGSLLPGTRIAKEKS